MGSKIGLTELVFRSEKRTNLLLFLRDGPKNIEDIKKNLNLDPISILPQIKKLKERDLILQKDHTYELSIIGRAIVDRVFPLMSTLEVLEDNFDYWSKRKLEGIPPFLRARIGELKNCKLIRPEVSNMFELNPEFVENLLLSSQVCSFTSFFHPSFASLYLTLAKKSNEIFLIFTWSVLQRFKTDYKDSLQTLIDSENACIFVFAGEPKIAGFTVTDRFFLFTILPEAKSFEHESLFSQEPEALKWGTDLFSYLQKETFHVKDLDF